MVAEELRASLTSFLGTTFALADEDVRAELERFIADEQHGVFRGPYVRLRLPFRPAQDGWQDQLGFVPHGFTPHRHQAEAWQRLSSLHHPPRPTLVTTGTGSGKTESFLVPLLDHCRRSGHVRGIKAIVLYPMNALANDQARRIAGLVHDHPDELGGVRVGLYTGDSPDSSTMSEGAVIGNRYELRSNPPDILLTNYKMLDMLLLRSEDKALFEGAGQSLRYLVLDEFHTYDGAQGTDVAMLLRRLGMAIGTTGIDGPLTGVAPVATSATLGSSADNTQALRDFAETVFGIPFSADAVVGEDRLTAEEWATGPRGAVPLLDQVAGALALCTSHEEVVEAAQRTFLGEVAEDAQALGRALRAHPLTGRLVAAAADARHLADVAAEVEPGWAARPRDARAAVSAYLAMLSEARDENGRPLMAVDVQLWLREVRRVARRLDVAPRFEWFEGVAPTHGQAMAALFCRHCGRSGWGAAAKAAGGYGINPDTVWRSSMTERRLQRAWIFAPGEGAAGDPRVHWVDGDSGELSRTTTGRHTTEVPVVVTPDDEAARKDRCPLCGLDDGIRFLGSSVATLASAALGQVFASPDIEPAQKKTLVFTDSVQDASHRASFIESRAYVLNRRSLLLRAVGPDGCTLDRVGDALTAAAHTAEERYAVLPPDLKEHATFRRYWQEEPVGEVIASVAKLMDFAAALEFGLSARVGRTLELTGAATAHVHVESLSDLVDTVMEAVDGLPVQTVLEDDALTVQMELRGRGGAKTVRWARGVLERIRLQGGIAHPWLDKYAASGGDRYSIWGGRPRREGMPAFPRGRPAPSFPTTAAASDAFDTVTGSKGWYARWTARALDVPTVDAPRYVRALLDAATSAGVLTVVRTDGNSRVWQLPPSRVHVRRTEGRRPGVLRCGICSSDLPAPDEVLAELAGAPCMRIGCPGTYSVTTLEPDYYRDLYRAGRVRRIVAHEHTSLLKADERVGLEKRFKQTQQAASDPNVLTCTPTLELGIDIGDLTMVALTSMPRSTASYLQRVGRAGRLTGSSLVLSLLPARPLELQRLVDPLTMIAGDVVPPACYLDAVEILRRQYLASLVDRQARAEQARPLRRAMDVFVGGLAPTSYLGRLMADARAHAEEYVTEFLQGFGDAVSKETAEDLRRWAGVDAGAEVPEMERAVELAVNTWLADVAELETRKKALQAEADRMDQLPSLDDAQKRDHKRTLGELAAIRRTLSEQRTTYWISVLEAVGLLPNYALLDDSTHLDVALWWTDEESGAAERSDDTYVRGSRTALSELAPGATFYVRGTSVEIDGLELGSSRNPATEDRRFCPSCGWSGPASTAISACPRCDDPAAADTGQIVRTLPFRKASAYASRELAQRDEDSDDRRRTSFTVLTTVDADPADIAVAWGLEDYQFGAEVLRRADIRWINVGPAARNGASLRIAGNEEAASRFEACTSCGVVWAAQRGVNSATEARHRGWCSQRRAPRADGWTNVVLTHHLRTQAVRLLVPPVVLVDRTLLTSFRAALLLGLRKVLGGDPDHLDVITAVDPAPGSVERWAMVLHDTVPGGTGYLARFGEPEEVQRLFQAALAALEACPCQDEDVAACHRCLLPHVPPQMAELARRDRAIELLTDVLRDWVPREIPALRSIEVGPHDTPIERRFRQLLIRWAKTQGASVTTQATSFGDRAELVFPAALGGLRWKLTPQVNHGFVVPDFDLTTDDPEVPTVTVFCDGVRYHAHPQCNRVADDATKRHELREQGALVWALTHKDLDAFEAALDSSGAPRPGWVTSEVATKTSEYGVQLCQAGDVHATAVLTDPVSALTAFLLRPETGRWAPAARAAVFALTAAFWAEAVTTEGAALPALLRADMLGETVPVPPGPHQVVMGRTAGGAALGIDLRGLSDVRAVLAVDDRDGIVGTDDHLAAWRDWLSLGNVLQFLEPSAFQSRSLEGLPVDAAVPAPVAMSPAWREVASTFEGALADLVRELATTGVDVPEAGLELADGEYLVDLAWPAARVAVSAEEDPERDDWLSEQGWTVLPVDVRRILIALTYEAEES
ncbi:DEAD/DEAH box helicase [Blastococcus sp. VKM Ac-2987]|uniref:DEAD/DEAH box helicase n=1 Tax=Blastococcus sp. VKM Ac-2987 TaxID=3004141 RepID=UPI0022ABBFEC|nr:DEAD/DEAH box helicase [Blastococcus sp. VKM Ac-2987]MCZ2859984.1 DEAD/DEAH box helicase [Blastococcus sp. VKM Ac-2987]